MQTSLRLHTQTPQPISVYKIEYVNVYLICNYNFCGIKNGAHANLAYANARDAICLVDH